GVLAPGRTTVGGKAGCGLAVRHELESLRLLKELGASPLLPRLVPTVLAAHEIPREYVDCRRDWILAIVSDILPRAAAEGLARFADVFCENGVYTVSESRQILAAARTPGFGLRIHADELALSGGAALAAELGAASADHLLFIGEREIALLARAGVAAVLLPGTAWWMRSRRAPARALVEA